jgi:hypothetical protein
MKKTKSKKLKKILSEQRLKKEAGVVLKGTEAMRHEYSYVTRIKAQPPPEIKDKVSWQNLYYEELENYNRTIWSLIFVSALVLLARFVVMR